MNTENIRRGDKVKVAQRIKDGEKSRIQNFEGETIKVVRKNSPTARITVRKIASGVGVEKSFLIHSPLIEDITITKKK